MNEQLEQNLNKIVEALIKATEKVVDAGSEQLPLLVQEVLKFGMYESLTWAIICGLALAILGIAWLNSQDRFDFAFVYVVVAFIPGAGFIYGVINLIKIDVAPRLYLLDYLRGLL